ncbi:hypothetical protein [Saccharothrix luteola]|uniref:hypothetical protein n=1 Tax=Saccharothrix luteola TaxID=2893018 RepID=UPI001E5C2132|nr:hypothetical protein [Saccharothrix luteola]MCC8247878.1 hypothetical protein [Saccharothrix luteola]
MSVHTFVRPVAAPADLAELSTLVAEPESTIGDPPLPEPNAAGALLLGLLISPPTPKEPRK